MKENFENKAILVQVRVAKTSKISNKGYFLQNINEVLNKKFNLKFINLNKKVKELIISKSVTMIENNKTAYRLKKYLIIRNLFIQFFLVLDLIYQISSKQNFIINQISNSYEVTLKVKVTGMKQIIKSGFNCPSQVYLNGNIQNIFPCYKLNVTVS